MKNSSKKVQRLALAAVLTAVIILLAFTPLGYLKVGIVSITLLVIPVVIGAIALGPLYGGFLGGVFGVTSFVQCFGMDPFGTTLMGLNPIATFVACMVPRILIGVFAGLLYNVLRRVAKNAVWPAAVTALVGSLTNTVLFIGMVILFFRHTYFEGSGVWAIIVGFFSLNVVVETISNTVLGAALGGVLDKVLRKE